MGDILDKSLMADHPMDYPLQLTSQLQQLLKSLRKSRQMTQAQLARHLGVVQSRIADIEREPGSVSVEQLMNVLAMLGAQLVVRETAPPTQPRAPDNTPDTKAPPQPASPDSNLGREDASTSRPPTLLAVPTSSPPSPSSAHPDPDDAPREQPRGQW
jgi:HTH-type transcriptional regulator / antitoxin HipB